MDPSKKQRDAARKNGQKKYNTWLPCARGHMALRWTSSGRCVECTKDDDRAAKALSRAHMRSSIRLTVLHPDDAKALSDYAQQLIEYRKALKAHEEDTDS